MKKKQKDKLTALVLDPQDNVATLLEDVCANAVIVLKGIEGYIHISENIAIGHLTLGPRSQITCPIRLPMLATIDLLGVLMYRQWRAAL